MATGEAHGWVLGGAGGVQEGLGGTVLGSPRCLVMVFVTFQGRTGRIQAGLGAPAVGKDCTPRGSCTPLDPLAGAVLPAETLPGPGGRFGAFPHGS